MAVWEYRCQIITDLMDLERFSALGAEEWELVAVENSVAFFKRRILAEPSQETRPCSSCEHYAFLSAGTDQRQETGQCHKRGWVTQADATCPDWASVRKSG